MRHRQAVSDSDRFSSHPQACSLNRWLPALVALALCCTPANPAAGASRPNVLWITCEDTAPLLGCYGDAFAVTPNLDAFAKQSVRYTNAFAYTGVCAPSRSGLITGVYPCRLGSQHMRSTTRLPAQVKCLPQYLAAAGYYCSNNFKQDYNFAPPQDTWHESSQTAHWRNRKPGQPFFSIFNINVTHQSQIFCSDKKYEQNTARLTADQRHDPAKVVIPPIHPDTPEFRKEWARHYDNVTAMDYKVGDLLSELEKDDLADDTIVFFFSDHGTGMPSIKMFAWDASLRVPLMIRFPNQWQRLAPAAPGSTTDRLVSFVDFAPTLLSLCGVDVPQHMQGVAFLGQRAAPPREFAFGGKDRQGECIDTIRYVHDGRFHYLRNFQPHLPWGQYMSFLHRHPSMRAWQGLHERGQLRGPAARFFEEKPAEELYDTQADPWEVNNLASDPRYRARLERLRAECVASIKRYGDLSLLPEREIHTRAAGRTPFELAVDRQANPLDRLLTASELASRRSEDCLPQLVELMIAADDSALRWWGALGLVALRQKARPALEALRQAARDESPDVRLAAAEALANLGRYDESLPLVREGLKHESAFIRLSALNIAQRLGAHAEPLLADIQAIHVKDPAQRFVADYVERMVTYLPPQIESVAAGVGGN